MSYYSFYRPTEGRRLSRPSLWDRHGQAAYEIFSISVDFDGPSLNFLCSRKPAHEGIKERYPRKSHYFTVVGQSFVKTVADGHGHAVYSTSDELSVVSTSMTEKPWTYKIRVFCWFLRSSAAVHTPRMNWDKMAGNRLTVCEQEML